MKKIVMTISLLLLMILVFAACGKTNENHSSSHQMTATEKIRNEMNVFSASLKKDDYQSIRQTIQNIEALSNDTSFSANEQKLARCVYCYISGSFKLLAAGNGVSAIQFPEVSILPQAIAPILNENKYDNIDEVLNMAESFLSAVNEEIR